MEIITTTNLIPISIISIRFFRVQFQHNDLVIFQMILRRLRLILLHMLFACVFLRLSFQLQLKCTVI